jgi:hypothetical protein
MARIVIAGLAFFLGMGLLIGMAVKEEGIPTVPLDHVVSPAYQGEEVFLVVRVESIQQMINPARFRVLDKQGGLKSLQVETREVLADTFGKESDLRIRGTYDPGTEVFTATWVDTKCPSKYEGTREDSTPPSE